MKQLLIAGILVAVAAGSFAHTPSVQGITDKAKAKLEMAVCDTCATVQTVKQEKRKGKGGILGMAGGAVVGGLLGNQVGGGTGKTIATVGGAVAGGVVGNEVQKKVTSKKVWVTSVKMKDGTVKSFEQDAQPVWVAGNVVKVHGGALVKQ